MKGENSGEELKQVKKAYNLGGWKGPEFTCPKTLY